MKQFTPIAMRCTQEQFEAIKPKLKGCEITDVEGFKNYCYLVNNFSSEENYVTNVKAIIARNNNRTVHEEWNEDVFLKACGIEVEKQFNLQGYSVEVDNEEQARQLQEMAFKQGYTWSYNKKNIILLDKKFFTFSEENDIRWSYTHSESKKQIHFNEIIKQLEDPAKENICTNLKQQLKEAKAEVKRIKALINEEHKIKRGDWVISANKNFYQKITVSGSGFEKWKKVTDPTLIKLLEEQLNK